MIYHCIMLIFEGSHSYLDPRGQSAVWLPSIVVIRDGGTLRNRWQWEQRRGRSETRGCWPGVILEQMFLFEIPQFPQKLFFCLFFYNFDPLTFLDQLIPSYWGIWGKAEISTDRRDVRRSEFKDCSYHLLDEVFCFAKCNFLFYTVRCFFFFFSFFSWWG